MDESIDGYNPDQVKRVTGCGEVVSSLTSNEFINYYFFNIENNASKNQTEMTSPILPRVVGLSMSKC